MRSSSWLTFESSNAIADDIRIAHKGNVEGEVIDGAFRVLGQFESVDASVEAMKALTLKPEEETALASAALTLRFGARTEGELPPPITAERLLEARRPEDLGQSLWLNYQRLQHRTCGTLNFGARRLRASKLAGRSEIPAFVDETGGSYDQVIENEPRDFALNLLFFHRGLNCLVAIELESGASSPSSWATSASP